MRGGIAMSEKYENDIVEDSYYLVNVFNRNNKQVTQLHIQKLMYFFEAYYMNMFDKENLYDCYFKAWALGPVAIPLYDEYKVFGSNSIKLSKEKENIGNRIDSEKKKLIDEIYDFFGARYTAMQLVNITHRDDSPWTEKWNENGKRVSYGIQGDIDKLKTKKWFKENFIE